MAGGCAAASRAPLALVEPLANTVAHDLFERWWERGAKAAAAPAWA
jgi:uncharacterized membrane protein